MARYAFLNSLFLSVLCIFTAVPTARAAHPSENLLPVTTKGYISIPSVEELRDQWNASQLGKLASDPQMQPFVEDLQRQLQQKLNRAGVKLALKWQDIDAVDGGEVCLAATQPGDEKSAHAIVLMVDVTGHLEDARALLKTVQTRQLENGAKQSADKLGQTSLLIFQLPKQENSKQADWSYYFIKDDQLIATDHRQTAELIHRHMSAQQGDALKTLPAFAGIMNHCSQAAGQLAPQVRWFIEPFGYAEVVRAAEGGRRKRGKDMLKVLANQGFDAVAGLGGYANFSTSKHELLHRTFVYAPLVKRKQGDDNQEKYNLAARMLDFPNRAPLEAQEWVPRELATYLSFNWKMQEAFYHIKTLVNELAGDDVFDDVLDGIRDDPMGPQVDLRKNLIAYLGERASLMTDYELPITPKSERLLMTVDLLNPKIVTQTINKALESDPTARKRVVNGHIIWEIINEPEEELPTAINAPEVFLPVALRVTQEEEEEDEEEETKGLPNSAVTVAHGHLMIATHIDFLIKVLSKAPASQSLAQSADYRVVQAELERLGASDDAFRYFSRTDEEIRPTYELIRQGKMPESETMLAKLLNRLLGPEDEDQLREQEIDGRKLPDFQVARRYLGPGGMFVKAESDGWLLTGIMLSK